MRRHVVDLVFSVTLASRTIDNYLAHRPGQVSLNPFQAAKSERGLKQLGFDLKIGPFRCADRNGALLCLHMVHVSTPTTRRGRFILHWQGSSQRDRMLFFRKNSEVIGPKLRTRGTPCWSVLLDKFGCVQMYANRLCVPNAPPIFCTPSLV
jgi:hypothetical protein